MKHTKGPWYLDEYGNLKSDSSKSTRNMVAFHGVCISDSDEAKANTALIAAAPDLLEALKGLYTNLFTDGFVTIDHMEKARAAIAKAEGL